MSVIYGLKNCDTCKKAIKQLATDGHDIPFKDFRKDGFAAEDVQRWLDAVGMDKLLNKRGTTWRGLDDAVKEGVSETNIVDLMVNHPALMKRPVFDLGDTVIVGFGKAEQAALQNAL